jgi:glycogen operon protein
MPYVLPGKQDVNWELLINTETEAGFLDQPASMASGDELDVCERSFCLLRLVKGTQSDAYSVSWKRQQKNQPTAPPAPRNQPGTSLRDATTVTKTTAPAPKEKPQPKEKAEAPAAKPEPAATKPEAKKEAAPAKPEKPEPPAKP